MTYRMDTKTIFEGCWDYQSNRQSPATQYIWPAVVEQLKDASPTSRVLDAGCGNGGFCRVLHENFGFEVYGCDLSATGIALARDAVPEGQFEKASVYDDLAAVFKTKFDVIISLEVIEHLFDPAAFIASMKQAMTNDGILILSTPYHGYLKNLFIALCGRCDKHYNPLNSSGHIKFWSKNTICTLFRESGFSVTSFRGVGRFPYLWKSMVVTANCRQL